VSAFGLNAGTAKKSGLVQPFGTTVAPKTQHAAFAHKLSGSSTVLNLSAEEAPRGGEVTTGKTFDLGLMIYFALWYLGNYFYNITNKLALNAAGGKTGFPMTISSMQLLIGSIYGIFLWVAPDARGKPSVTLEDIVKMLPVAFCFMGAHSASVFAMGMGSVSFAQIVKACEPAFAAVIGLLIPPVDVKPVLAYAMLIPIVGGVGLACVKEGKGVDINVTAFAYASMANVAAALKGKLGSGVTKALKGDAEKNMDSANVYAVMNIISFCCTVPFVVVTELPTLGAEWNKAVEEHGSDALIKNILLSGLFFYIYNEFAFAFTAAVGAVTSSVLNTAKRVIIIVVSTIVFQEAMERNTVLGSAIAIGGTFGYSLAAKKKAAPKKKAD
jgi:solute carrier family 35 protein E1